MNSSSSGGNRNHFKSVPLIGRLFKGSRSGDDHPYSNGRIHLNESDIDLLINMGFTRDQVTRALKESNNDIHAAANSLIGNG